VLGITSIDPERNDLLFERFVSQERKEPPDIDVDFEHERREEVIQWVYNTYASSWLKCWHPDAFCVGLLNAQPMGFYAPAQIVRDAIDHGVEIRPVDINASRWDSTLEPTDIDGRFAVRLGFRLVAGLKNDEGAKLAAARGQTAFVDVEDAWRRSGVQVSSLVRLAEADAFRASMGAARRDALWAIKALRDNPLPLFANGQDQQTVPEVNEIAVRLKAMTAGHEVIEDYAHKRSS
jgi:error-prone DNA polymerase